ncbi:MAG: AAA family ATPase [Synechococcales bacterium]|nr:AAA family ATPase [Synechococcales bacterium]
MGIHQLLVGVPGAGKSTVAEVWRQSDPEGMVVIATDQIRAELFGDATIQGHWAQVEAVLLQRVGEAIAQGKTIICDGTHAKRAWRVGMLRQFAQVGARDWVAWQVNTPIETCLKRNQRRERQVPEQVILDYAYHLKKFPVSRSEGFLAVQPLPIVDGQLDLAAIHRFLKKGLGRSIQNAKNRVQGDGLHAYSAQVDFDRLLHLMALLLQFPGLGNLQEIAPQIVQEIFGRGVMFEDSLDEVSAVMARLRHPIYADRESLARDLAWLAEAGILDAVNRPIQAMPLVKIPRQEFQGQFEADYHLPYWDHSFSSVDSFLRLMEVIRAIAHEPFFKHDFYKSDGLQKDFLGQLRPQDSSAAMKKALANFRKDIETVLIPYGILLPVKSRQSLGDVETNIENVGKQMGELGARQAYFLGTSILRSEILRESVVALRRQASLQDPIALGHVVEAEQRLRACGVWQGVEEDWPYDVRVIADPLIVNMEKLPRFALAKQVDRLLEAIRRGRQIRVKQFTNVRSSDSLIDGEYGTRVYPLQVLYHKIAWYVGCEFVDGRYRGLFCFMRLDRLMVLDGDWLEEGRSRDEQVRAFKRLDLLRRSSMGIFLGRSVADQMAYLDGRRRGQVEVKLRLHVRGQVFQYFAEGNQRFLPKNVRMTLPSGFEGTVRKIQGITYLQRGSGDRDYPYVYEVRLPGWSLEDFDLKRWVLGFGDQVKVVGPIEFVRRLAKDVEKTNALLQASLRELEES